jgi:tRNA threonylcarbamoyladenosine biosynthesis protein TsaE
VTPTVTAHVEVKPVGSDEAATVHAVVHAAFEDRPPLDPPAAALAETAEQLEARLASHGGLLARVDGVPAGALILDPVGRTMYLRRFGVVPSMQGHGVAAALIDAAVEAADGYEDITVVAREELPATIRFWERQGFREIRRQPPNVELRRPLRTAVFQAPDADAMRGLGRSIAGQLAPGDLIVLTGALGAGKTTFTQGLGAGLGVRGAVTSPTFVIARLHPSEIGGPALVHVDAYRIGGIAELDDLDLDTSFDQAVTVVEWGEGLAEGLADSRLEVRIVRAEDDDSDERRVEITPVGPRWHALSFRGLG